MNSEIPDRQHQQSNPIEKHAGRPQLPIETVDEDRADKRDQLTAMEQPDDRRAMLAGLVLDNWSETDGSTTCFGLEVDPALVPEKLADILQRIETDFGFDLIADGLQSADIGDLLRGQLEASQAEAAAEQDALVLGQETARTEQVAEQRDAYQNLIEEHVSSGKSNAEIIHALAQDPRVPAAERVKLAQFAAIIEIAQEIPADAEIILARVETVDLSSGVPDPKQFAQAFIFDTPGSALPSGVSETTQIAVAEVLGIERPELDVVTGSEMTDVFEKGIGTRTVRDPETGELREELIMFEPGQFEEIRDGQSIGLTETGARAMRFEEKVCDFTVLLPDTATAEDMVMYGLAGQMMSQLHEVNMAEAIFPGRNFMERGGGTLDIRMPEDFNRTQRLCQIFFGGFAGHDGALLSQSDLDRIPYLMQFQSAKGDAVIGDINPEQMRADYRRQGIIDDDGNFDWDVFAAMVEANRLALWTGEEHFGRAAA